MIEGFRCDVENSALFSEKLRGSYTYYLFTLSFE